MIHVYTGNGKGKTTAALGLALRASGAGHKVYICQFLKGNLCCEHLALKKLKNIKIEQFGAAGFIRSGPKKKDLELTALALEAALNAVKSRKYNLIILDEVCVALNLRLLKLGDLVGLMNRVPKKTDLVLTGRLAHPKVIELADLVSEIKDIKHYYRLGQKARRGIEL